MAAATPSSGRRVKPLPEGVTPNRREEKSLETRGRILDAAEELFALHGIYGVTLRDIASLAEVDTALLHYYFDTKNNIFKAVVERRAAMLRDQCGAEMDAYEAKAGSAITVEGIVGAYVRPVFRLNRTGGKAWRNYCAIVLRLGNAPEWAGEAIAEHFDPLVHHLVRLLRKALPGASDSNLYWCYHLLARAITITSMPKGRVERLSGGRIHSDDFDAMEPIIVRFVSEGIRGVCAR
jgi:AcrR family transcriptional regulator